MERQRVAVVVAACSQAAISSAIMAPANRRVLELICRWCRSLLMADQKRVFISYSHNCDARKQWGHGLASFLVEHGIEVILDQWNLRYGDDNDHRGGPADRSSAPDRRLDAGGGRSGGVTIVTGDAKVVHKAAAD